MWPGDEIIQSCLSWEAHCKPTESLLKCTWQPIFSLCPGLALHLVFPRLAGQLFFISGHSHTQGESRCERQLKDQPRFKSSRQRLHIVRGRKVYVSRRKIINDNSLWSYLCKKWTVIVTATLLISLVQRFLKEPQLFILNHRAVHIWIKDEQRILEFRFTIKKSCCDVI